MSDRAFIETCSTGYAVIDTYFNRVVFFTSNFKMADKVQVALNSDDLDPKKVYNLFISDMKRA